MTTALTGAFIASIIKEHFHDAVTEHDECSIVVDTRSLLEVLCFLKDRPKYDLAYLNYITAVDYYDYFEIIYQFTSLEHNHSLVVKTRCSRENSVVPSVTSLWQGADFQEREIYDLMGITFEGHPNMKRLFLWEGFEGHPLRKDYL